MAEAARARNEKQKTKVLRMERDLWPDESQRLREARGEVGEYRSHYNCVAAYMAYCGVLVELGMKPEGYSPSIHRVQTATGISCWRTVKRCVDKWKSTLPA